MDNRGPKRNNGKNLARQQGNPASAQPPQPVLPAYSWRLRSPRTNLIYIRDCNFANQAIQDLRGQSFGFDLEWKPIFRKEQRENPVALVQIASDDTILLIQLSAMSGLHRTRLFLPSLQSHIHLKKFLWAWCNL